MSRILEKLADQHEERIINVLYKLEEDVVKEVTRATKGQLVSQRLAIQLQPRIRNLIQIIKKYGTNKKSEIKRNLVRIVRNLFKNK